MTITKISNAWTGEERNAVVRKIADEMEGWQNSMPPRIADEYAQRLRRSVTKSPQYLEAHRADILGDDWRDWTYTEPTS